MIVQDIKKIREHWLPRIAEAHTPEELEKIRVEVLGRKGAFTRFGGEMRNLPPAEKAEVGQLLNRVKAQFEQEITTRQEHFANSALAARLESEWLDLTLPAPGIRPGSLHPVTQLQQEIEDLFRSLGFTVLDG